MNDDPRLEVLARTIMKGFASDDEWELLLEEDRADLMSAARAVVDLIDSGGLEFEMEELEDWAFEVDLMDPVALCETYRNLGINDTMDGKNRRAQYITKRATEYRAANPDEWNRITKELQRHD